MACGVAAHEETELPEGYGRSRVTLLAIDPFHVHAYWEVTAEDRRRATEQLKAAADPEAARWTLRFYDVTPPVTDEASGHGHFDVPIELESNNWYVDLWSAKKSYFVVLGLQAGERFIRVCRSTATELPPADPSPTYDPKWATVSTTPEGPSRVKPALDPELSESTRRNAANDAPAAAEIPKPEASRSTSLAGSSSSRGRNG